MCANKDAESQMRVNWEGPHRLEKGTSVSAELHREVNCEIPRQLGKRVDTRGGVPTRTLYPDRRWIVRSHVGWRGERSIIYILYNLVY